MERERERAATAAGGEEADWQPRRDRRLALLSGLAAGFYLLGFAGLALLPVLTRDHPLLLILINPTSSVLFLVSARVELLPFVVVATARRFASHLVFFLLGRWYAGRAVRWMEQRGGGALPLVPTIERLFARVGWLVIAVWPGPLPSTLAGAGRWRPALFVALDLAAVVGSVVVARLAAEAAASPLEVVLEFIDRNADWLTVLLIVAVVLWLVVRRLRERGGADNGAPRASRRAGRDDRADGNRKRPIAERTRRSTMSSTLERATLTAPDISCAHCVAAINKAVGGLDGVGHVATSEQTKQVQVEFDPARVSLAQIEAAMDEEGYPVQK